MLISKRVKAVKESITLKLNDTASKMVEKGLKVYNLTAGQLPFKPNNEFIEKIQAETNFLKSYQYSPVAGFADLRKKLVRYIETSRNIHLPPDQYECVVSNGAKHSVYNALGTLINPGDEVIVLAPYWVSYPEMIRCWGGIPIVVKGEIFSGFCPEIEELERSVNKNTKAIIINSPNNPAGVHYPQEWMQELGKFLIKHPDVMVISDEIYFEITYFDPKPTYFYQYYPELLKRTMIIDGISKSLACTGLRIGYTIGPKEAMDAFARLQAQTTSGANSLIQRALATFPYENISSYLKPINEHLRHNANTIQDAFHNGNLSSLWYQCNSAFYFMVDFTATPLFQALKSKTKEGADGPMEDFAQLICEEALEKHGLALVPGTDFGYPNGARMSIVLEDRPFFEAMTKLVSFLNMKGPAQKES